MNAITKVRKLAKLHGFAIRKKTLSFGETWTLYHVDSGNPVGNLFASGETPKRLQAFRAAVAAMLSLDDWATLPPQLAKELK